MLTRACRLSGWIVGEEGGCASSRHRAPATLPLRRRLHRGRQRAGGASRVQLLRSTPGGTEQRSRESGGERLERWEPSTFQVVTDAPPFKQQLRVPSFRVVGHLGFGPTSEERRERRGRSARVDSPATVAVADTPPGRPSAAAASRAPSAAASARRGARPRPEERRSAEAVAPTPAVATALLSSDEEAQLMQQLRVARQLERVRQRLCDERTAASLRSTEELGAIAAAAAAPASARGAPSELEWARCAGLPSVHALRDAVASGKRARDVLVSRNMGLVWQAAARYRGNAKLGVADLVQEGAAGLVHATELFDLGRGVKFSTYAYAWVNASVKRAVQNEGRTVRIPVWLYEVQSKLLVARSALAQAGVPAPTTQQLAAAAGLSLQRVAAATAWFAAEGSLDEEVGRGNAARGRETSLVDTLPAAGRDAPEAEREVGVQLMRLDLLDILDTLLDKERFVLRCHFGLNGEPPATVKNIALRLGVRPPVVSKILNAGLNKLRHPQRAGYLAAHGSALLGVEVEIPQL